MHVKIMIKRTIPKEKAREMLTLINALRNTATHRRGFITGETLWNVDKPHEYVVVSTWRSLEYWDAWVNSDERKELQKKIDELDPKSMTTYERYRFPDVDYDAPMPLV